MAERVERRLAAILAADVVGYSRLMAADEAGTRAQFNAHLRELIEPAVADHRGRVVKTTGDGLLIEFASVVDAVQCAAAIQEGMADRNESVPDDRRMAFRIGVNLGDVIVEGGDIHGDGVNVASRLEALAETGGICVSGTVFDSVGNKLPLGFEDMGAQRVKNIAEPVRTYRVLSEGDAAGTIATAKSGAPKRWWWAAAAVAAVVVVGSAAVWNFYLREQVPETVAVAEAKQLSIVVLPFANLSGDPDQDYFADGITEDLITDLSRIKDMFVIARGTSFTYKGKAVKATDVARDLKVRYVLEGSVRRDADLVRVNAQLIDGQTGAHVWSDRFDRELRNVFSLQNEITGRLASVLKGELLEAESYRARQGLPANLEAWDYALQGWVIVYVIPQQTDQTLLRAKSLLEKALELDPNLGFAWTGLARFHYKASAIGIKGISRTESRKRLLETAAQAVLRNPNDPDALAVQGHAYRLNRLPGKALPACQTALQFNPNHDEANVCAGLALMALGQSAEAFPYFDKAARLNPYQRPFRLMHFQAMAHLTAGQYDAAVDLEKKAIASNPKFTSSHFVLSSALAWSGDLEGARAALKEFLKLDDGRRSTIEGLRASNSYMSPNFDHVLEGLRRAGMPETEADKPPSMSIVVLPFANLSGDPKQDYFADGITEDLITDLSRIRGAFVIARGTSFTYTGKAVNPKDVAADLGVRYVLEGSVRREGDQVRVNAQLIDGETGAHIWSDRFDRKFADVFSLQDEITGRIASTLRLELLRAESDRLSLGRPENLEAWDYALRGWAALWAKPLSARTMIEAEPELRKALELDPRQALAWAGMARFYQMQFVYTQWRTMDQDEALAKSLEAARLAVAYDPRSAEAHVALGYGLRTHGRDEAAEHAYKTALELNPNYEEAYVSLGILRLRQGRPEEALQYWDISLRLAPRIPNAARRYFFIGQAQLMAKRHDQAVAAIQKGIAADANYPPQYQVLASALAWLGRIDEAKQALAKYAKLNPRGNSIAALRRIQLNRPYFEHTYEGLRRAGMPEE